MPTTADSAVSLLIVDDDPDSLTRISSALAQPGLEIITARTAADGLGLAYRLRPRIVLATPRTGGPDMLERIVETDSSVHVIRLPGQYAKDGGRPDKPLSSIADTRDEGVDPCLVSESHKKEMGGLCALPELRERVAGLAREVRSGSSPPFDAAVCALGAKPSDESQPDTDFEGIVGRSPLMSDMFTRVRRIAPYYRAALITGETGTGKDLAARALHQLSPVSKGRYVVLNCPAVVETLFESELFGHVKGAFTGASTDKPGLFEHADRGTLFLDEIGDMPLATQAKLLRVLQNSEVQRVGSLSVRKMDVRVIAATNHDLRTLIAEKRFREDLYYRLSMVEIRLPSLAERKEDLPALQRHFVARFAAAYGKEITGLTHAAHHRLSQHSWPGNVRELENVIGRAAMMADGKLIDIPDLPPYLQAEPGPGVHTAKNPALQQGTLHQQEGLLLIRALEAAGGNQSQAARALRIGRDALRYKIRKHNLEAAAERVLAASV